MSIQILRPYQILQNYCADIDIDKCLFTENCPFDKDFASHIDLQHLVDQISDPLVYTPNQIRKWHGFPIIDSGIITDSKPLMDDIFNELSEDYNDFLWSCFKPYGITSDNISEWKDRITLVTVDYTDIIKTKQIYINEDYSFTITTYDEGLVSDGLTLKKSIRFIKSE